MPNKAMIRILDCYLVVGGTTVGESEVMYKVQCIMIKAPSSTVYQRLYMYLMMLPNKAVISTYTLGYFPAVGGTIVGVSEVLKSLVLEIMLNDGVKQGNDKDFSLLSFEILTWDLIYEFVLTKYRSSSTFVEFDQLFALISYCPLLKYRLSLPDFSAYWLKFVIICFCLDVIQIKFNCCCIWLNLTGVIALFKN